MIQPEARPPIAQKIKKAFVIAVTVALLVLSACDTAPQVDAIQTPVEATAASTQVSATLEATATVAPTPEPTQIVEPMMIPAPSRESLPVNPPNFNNKDNSVEHGAFDLYDAHAVYAFYRQQQGPDMWTTNEQFIAEMETYLNGLRGHGIEMKQATVEGVTYSALVNGNSILLDFNQDGTLRDITPGGWSKDSQSQWIDVGAATDLFIGEDDLPYIAKLDADGNVIAFLNPMGATLDNLDQQWIGVQDGLATKIWNKESGQYESVYYRWDDPELLGKVTTEFEQKFGMPWDQFYTKLLEQKYVSRGVSYMPLIEEIGYYIAGMNGMIAGQEIVTDAVDKSNALVVYVAMLGTDKQPLLIPLTVAVGSSSKISHTTINSYDGYLGDFIQNNYPIISTNISQLQSEIDKYVSYKADFDLIIRFGTPDECNQTSNPRYKNTTTSSFWKFVNETCKVEGTYLNYLSNQPTRLDPYGRLNPKLMPDLPTMLSSGESRKGLIVDWFGINTLPPQH